MSVDIEDDSAARWATGTVRTKEDGAKAEVTAAMESDRGDAELNIFSSGGGCGEQVVIFVTL